MDETPFDAAFRPELRLLRMLRTPPRRLTNGERDDHDPHWKRVAKDRAKRKAAKQQKKQMRSR